MTRMDPNRSGARKAIMVTGASSGIGRATADLLAEAGHLVFAAARRRGALDRLVAEHPNVRSVPLDVTDRASIAGAVELVQRTTDARGLDVLVNAAGTMTLGPVEAMPDDQARAQFEVNVFGLLAVTRAFVPAMRERGAGRVVNVSSVLGRFVLPGQGIYSASKFAVEAISDALRMELRPFGIDVVVVEPGVTDTSLYRSAEASTVLDDQVLAAYRPAWPGGFGFPERLRRTAGSVGGVADHVARAALAVDPRPRYRPGLRNRVNSWLLTRLPTRAADRTRSRIAGVSEHRMVRPELIRDRGRPREAPAPSPTRR